MKTFKACFNLICFMLPLLEEGGAAAAVEVEASAAAIPPAFQKAHLAWTKLRADFRESIQKKAAAEGDPTHAETLAIYYESLHTHKATLEGFLDEARRYLDGSSKDLDDIPSAVLEDIFEGSDMAAQLPGKSWKAVSRIIVDIVKARWPDVHEGPDEIAARNRILLLRMVIALGSKEDSDWLASLLSGMPESSFEIRRPSPWMPKMHKIRGTAFKALMKLAPVRAYRLAD